MRKHICPLRFVSVCLASVVPESGSKSAVGYFWASLTCRRTLCTAVRVVQYCSPHPIVVLTKALHAVISHPALYFKPPDRGPLPLSGPHAPCVGQTTQTRCQGNHPDVLWPL